MSGVIISHREGALIDPDSLRFVSGPLQGQHLSVVNARSLRWLTVTRSLSVEDIQLIQRERRRRYKLARANAHRSLSVLPTLPHGVKVGDLERIIQCGESVLRKRCRKGQKDSEGVIAAAVFLRHLVPVGKAAS